jgi:hypothetical protein
MKRLERSIRLAIAATLCLPLQSLAFDPGVAVTVNTWSSDAGHGYIAVQANGNWAPPASTPTDVQTEFYSNWENMGNPGAFCHAWWVTVIRRSDGTIVNGASPVSLIRCGPEPVVGVASSAMGDLSLYLAVAVDPVSAPARTARTVVAELTAGWRDWIDDAMNAYIRRSSVRVRTWTVDFGDGTRQTFPGDAVVPDRLVTTHAYDAGQFVVIVTAHITGDAYGAFFAPNGTPFEQVVPFTLDISNVASGVSALPIDYLPPVVTVGGSPSGTLPNGVPVAADVAGHADLWWPRGLPCALLVRSIVEQEGFMRSGGVVIGGAKTRLLSYHYEAGPNDASDPTRSGTYPAAAAIQIQWDTPLPGTKTYPVRLVLDLETTYDDGTVRTSQAAGVVSVTVIYSAISQ